MDLILFFQCSDVVLAGLFEIGKQAIVYSVLTASKLESYWSSVSLFVCFMVEGNFRLGFVSFSPSHCLKKLALFSCSSSYHFRTQTIHSAPCIYLSLIVTTFCWIFSSIKASCKCAS